MHNNLHLTSARVVWTADTRSILSRSSAAVLLADLFKHVAKRGRMHEFRKEYRLTWRVGAIG